MEGACVEVVGLGVTAAVAVAVGARVGGSVGFVLGTWQEI